MDHHKRHLQNDCETLGGERVKILPDEPTEEILAAMDKAGQEGLDAAIAIDWADDDKEVPDHFINKSTYKAILAIVPCPWTKIEGPETLPEKNGHYLFRFQGFEHPEIHWFDIWEVENTPPRDCLACRHADVTYWMRLPEPPK